MKVPTRAEPIIAPRMLGGLSIEPIVLTTPSTAATMPSAGSASPSDVSVVCGPCTSWWWVLIMLSITSSTACTSSVPDETTTRRSVSAIRLTSV
jgi:hypothetical protein